MKAIFFIAYYIYAASVLFGTGYAVFILDRSGWWFVVAALFLSNSPTIQTQKDEQ